MTIAINELKAWVTTPDKPYVHFDLGLTEAQQAMFDAMRIESDGSYNNFGASNFIEDDTASFLRKLGNSGTNAAQQAKIIAITAKTILTAFRQERCWLTLRATTPSHRFDIPRWHMDGRFYNSDHIVVKAAMAFKGRRTLVAKLTQAQRKCFMNRERFGIHGIVYDNREELAKLIGKRHEAAPVGHGTAFVVGDRGKAAIHSEPSFEEARLFVSVLPGTRLQIEELSKGWGEEARFMRISGSDYKL